MKKLLGGFLVILFGMLAIQSDGHAQSAPVDWSSNGWNYIGKNGGIAGLDSSGKLNGPLTAGDTPSVSNQYFPRLLAGNTGADMFAGSNSVIVGGQSLGTMPNALNPIGVPSNLNVFAMPDGTFGNGCSLCLQAGPGDWGHKRVGLSGVDFRGVDGSGQANILSSDATGFYNWVGNTPGYFTLDIDHIVYKKSSWVPNITTSPKPAVGDTQIVTTTNINTDMTALSHSVTHYFANGGSEKIAVTNITQTSSAITLTLASAITKVDDATKDTYTFNDTAVSPDSDSVGVKIYLKTPLTAAQMSVLHPNMYLQTNVMYNPPSQLKSAVSDSIGSDNLLPPYGFYSGNIIAWDPNGSWIETPALVATGANDRIVNQVLDLTKLDTFWTNYDHPVLMVGQSVGVSAQNNYLDFNDDNNTGTNQNPTRALRYNEVDFRYKVSKEHGVNYSGLVLTNACYTGSTYCGTNAYTDDSTSLVVNADTPYIFQIGMASNAILLDSPPVKFSGSGGVSDTVPYREAFRFTQWESGAHSFNFMGYIRKDAIGLSNPIDNVSANTTSYHIGVGIDTGNSNHTTTLRNQWIDPTRLWSEIIWNNQGLNNGGLDLCGGVSTDHTKCALYLTYNNALFLQNGFTTNLGQKISFGSGYIKFDTNGSIDLYPDSTSNAGVVNAPNLSISSAGWNSSTHATGGQGSLLLWNVLSGDGATYLTNVNPGTTGGFKFYDIGTGGTITTSSTALLWLRSGYAAFNVPILAANGGIEYKPTTYATLSNHGYPGTTYWCSDCTSKLRDASYTGPSGVLVTWNGSDWVDIAGPVNHP